MILWILNTPFLGRSPSENPVCFNPWLEVDRDSFLVSRQISKLLILSIIFVLLLSNKKLNSQKCIYCGDDKIKHITFFHKIGFWKTGMFMNSYAQFLVSVGR